MSPDVPMDDAGSTLLTVRDGKSIDLMSVYFWTDDEKKAYLLSRGVTPAGNLEPLPTECPLCGKDTSHNYEIHMILQHPETRPKPAKTEEPEKKRKGKKK